MKTYTDTWTGWLWWVMAWTIFMIALVSHGAPLPPFPTVKRPAPLLSPKAASVPKSAPMVKASSFTPAGSVSGFAPLRVDFTKDFNFFHCDTNDPSCLLYDITAVGAVQRANKGLKIEYTDTIPNTGGWNFAAEWGPYVEDYEVGFTWFHETAQRLPIRIFRAVEVEPAISQTIEGAFAPASAGPRVRVNPALKGFMVWSRPRK